LPTYKQPKYIQTLDSLPKNAAGKVMKLELRKLEVAYNPVTPL
jgi:acyl-coenzyme A synthetase/AMP-(fatty) acid ligase